MFLPGNFEFDYGRLKNMRDYLEKCLCCIHSLNGELAEATIIKRIGDNQYLAEYNGVQCTAIFNPFSSKFYVDDKYGVIKDTQPAKRPKPHLGM